MHVELVVPPNTSKSNSSGKSSTGNSRMFPVLVFLLVACYGIMTLVVVEQGNVIQSQRNLIGQLMQDSSQLSAMKNQGLAQKAIEKKQAEALRKGKAGRENSSPKQVAPMQNGSRTEARNEQGRKLLGRKSRIEKEPMQADDKVDRRRFPSEI